LAGADNQLVESLLTPHGFGGLSRRKSLKPIIGAANGDAYGGGLEILLNCDLVVASEKARFGQTETHIGVTVGAGGLERLVRTAGRQVFPSRSVPQFVDTELHIYIACRRTTANSQNHLCCRGP
jgi:1,4-dihydroxy-2-naphthoyl-CoA synthase